MSYMVALSLAAMGLRAFGALNVYHATAGDAETAPSNPAVGVASSALGLLLAAARYSPPGREAADYGFISKLKGRYCTRL